MEPIQHSPASYPSPMTPATPQMPAFPSPQPPQQGTWKMPVAIVIGVLVLAGGAYALLGGSPDPIAEQTPTPSAVGLPVSSPAAAVPADWKTYTNTEYGFEFRYPKEYEVTAQSENGFLQISATPPDSFETDKITGLNMSVMTAKQMGDHYGEATVTAYPIAPISGQKTFELIKQPEMGSSYRVSYFQFQGDYLVFSRDPKNPIADQILSTFKFIEPTSAVPADWRTFSSKYFTLSFKIPPFTQVVDAASSIRIAKTPYSTREIGDDNAFLSLTRYVQPYNKAERIAYYRKFLKNVQESTTIVSDSSFLTMRGDDYGRFEGGSAGKVTVVFFDASWLEIIERPANATQDFDSIAIGEQILSTFKFTK